MMYFKREKLFFNGCFGLWVDRDIEDFLFLSGGKKFMYWEKFLNGFMIFNFLVREVLVICDERLSWFIILNVY